MTDYFELAKLADRILAISDDDAAELAAILDDVDEDVRNELLVSDFLNAYQVFWYFYRYEPEILAAERLMLSSASSLSRGVLIEERDLFQILFRITDSVPEMLVSDGEDVLMVFRGRSAYRDAAEWADSN
ncbi:hypothetical protein [Methanogenium organophilum]|uniref:Uncharacterized protein n=1 Tax=Methanogenium organophilum TaxID=2199 RepID=A0A9X9S4F4_METOG|nr:hypothetical protein [Methanogenium organophilum]WAI01486.1 hypothetical protein OU421_01035 [Methanogenium organophilum]